MKTKLSKIATIQSGLYQKPEPLGEVLYLQTRHFNEVGEFDQLSQPERISDLQIDKHILKQDDILFAAKGTKNFAALYRSSIGKAVASSSLYVIRVNSLNRNTIHPEFLCWYINSIEGQLFLKLHAKGTALPSIPISVLQEMEISIPNLQIQQQIIDIQSLRTREHLLLSEIDHLKGQLLQRQLLSITK
jgi:restriction endonuclease S subunit